MSIKTFSYTAAEFHSWIIISEEMHSVYRQIGSYSTQLKRGWSRYITQGSRLTCWIGSKSMQVSHLSHTGILIELCHVRLQLQVQSPSIDSKSVLNSGRFPPLYITSWSLAYVEFGKRSTPYVCFFVWRQYLQFHFKELTLQNYQGQIHYFEPFMGYKYLWCPDWAAGF